MPSTLDIIVAALKVADLSALPNHPASCHKGKHNQLPPIPAVYVVFCPPKEVLYIGRTRNLRQRWRTWRFSIVKWRVTWFEVPTVEQAAAEKWLIQKFRPSCNIVHNREANKTRRLAR